MSELNLILLGKPGAGKGTQAERLKDDFGLPYIGTGDLLRKHKAEGTELGREAQKYMDDGRARARRPGRADDPRGDRGEGRRGLPARRLPAHDRPGRRARRGARRRAAAGSPPRSTSTRTTTPWSSGCPAAASARTGTSTTRSSTRRRTTGFCDQCGRPLIQREDDQADTIRTRLETYHRETEPLIDYYEERGLLRRFDGSRRAGRGPRPHPCHARRAPVRREAVIVRKTPAEIDAMAKAGEIHVRTMDLLAGKIRAGVTTGGARRRGGEVHPLAGRDAGVQGLPRLPRLDLRVAEPHGRARDPGQVQAAQGRHPVRRHRRGEGRLGRRRRAHVPGGGDLAGRREAARGHGAVAVRRGRAVPGRQPARRRLARGADPRRGARLLGRAVARRPRHRPLDARGAPDPQLRPARQGPGAGGGDGARDRADGHRRAPHGADGRRRLGDLLAGRLAGRALRVHGRRSRRPGRGSSRRGTSPRAPRPEPPRTAGIERQAGRGWTNVQLAR